MKHCSIYNLYLEEYNKCIIISLTAPKYLENTHVTHNIAERCQEYFKHFIAMKILSQHYC